MTDAVLLIPGFFGFGSFGSGDEQVRYFGEAVNVIEEVRPALAGRVLVHEPPPTGSLDERIASLHDAIIKIRDGVPLEHNPRVQANRIHLIGHSTGGVDAWLYTRPQYRWAGGPFAESRADLLGLIGDVVTLSAPFRGTPIAKYARSERDVFLVAVHALTILGGTKLGAAAIAKIVARLLSGTNPGDQVRALAASLDAVAPEGEDEFVTELLAFFTRIVEDRQLLRDLTVEAMGAVNEALVGGNHTPIRSYVSVAPPPQKIFTTAGIAALFDVGGLPARELYSHLYADTSGGVTPGPIPKLVPGGLSLGADVIAQLHYELASDGVVPVTSQTLAGEAEGIILGDHLDVTGHYGGEGDKRDVFVSGAAFSAASFKELWTHIARGLTPAQHARSGAKTSPASFA